VIAWVDKSKITLPTPQTSFLGFSLNTIGLCSLQLLDWIRGIPSNLKGQADADYANAWLLIHSANNPPLESINPTSEKVAGDFRLFKHFQIVSNGDISNPTALPNAPPVVGSTPDPCGTPLKLAGETNRNSGYWGPDSSGRGVAQLVEGRVGSIGQQVNRAINGTSTPWIWNVIEFDSTGSILVPMDHAMFPTYSIYVNGRIALTCPQSAPAPFVAKDDKYQRLPSDIPVTSGLTSCHN